ncbi:MAG: mannitol dehydrogenase family protein, partial [Actinomycetales bacterium]|nr:mannitol dehydrogenase family protein [Actinomycetales bacterium]
ADVALVRELTGRDDPVPVVTEPFTEWVLEGEFPGGRPRWEDAGATFTDDIEPFETRKLYLLNGAHSLLAYAGPARGHETVAEAVRDPEIRAWVEAWWDEATSHLTLPAEDLAEYRAALLERFENPQIRHLLTQIEIDGSKKLRERINPTLRAELEAGRTGEAAIRVLAAWLVHLRSGAEIEDVAADRLAAAAEGDLEEAAARVLAVLEPGLDESAHAAVAAHLADTARELSGRIEA